MHCSSRTRPGPKVVHGKLIEKRRKKITLRIQIFHYLSSSKQFLQCTQCLENGNHQKSLILQHFKNLVDSWTTELLDIWTLDNFLLVIYCVYGSVCTFLKMSLTLQTIFLFLRNVKTSLNFATQCTKLSRQWLDKWKQKTYEKQWNRWFVTN